MAATAGFLRVRLFIASQSHFHAEGIRTLTIADSLMQIVGRQLHTRGFSWRTHGRDRNTLGRWRTMRTTIQVIEPSVGGADGQ